MKQGMPSANGARPPGQRDVLVVVFLRGGADALSLVVPHGDDDYYRQRPTLAIPRPGDATVAEEGRAIDLDGFFGLHPSLGPLVPAWEAGHLAPVVACGAPDDSRSHFRAQELIERGVTTPLGPTTGWLGRHLAARPSADPSPLRAVAVSRTVPRSLLGPVAVSAILSLDDVRLSADPGAAKRMRALLGALHEGDGAEPWGDLAAQGRDTLAVLDALEHLSAAPRAEAKGDGYPDTELGRALSLVGALVRAEVGLEVATVDHGGWDTHFTQGGADGLLAGLARDLASSLAALYADLRAHLDRLTVVVLSEFGRRVGENASLGTDHGHGGMMLLMGGSVIGGRVHGTWPGLSEADLVGPGDLAVTTDMRDVLGEALARRHGPTDLDAVFPEHAIAFPGVVGGL